MPTTSAASSACSRACPSHSCVTSGPVPEDPGIRDGSARPRHTPRSRSPPVRAPTYLGPLQFHFLRASARRLPLRPRRRQLLQQQLARRGGGLRGEHRPLHGRRRRTRPANTLAANLLGPAKVLKVSHHCSDTGYNEAVFDAVQPQYAICTSGSPDPTETIATLRLLRCAGVPTGPRRHDPLHGHRHRQRRHAGHTASDHLLHPQRQNTTATRPTATSCAGRQLRPVLPRRLHSPIPPDPRPRRHPSCQFSVTLRSPRLRRRRRWHRLRSCR